MTTRGASKPVAAPVWMVRVAVALPLASKVTELGSIEQVGAYCVGCTEQLSATGLSKLFWWLSVIVEVELWPRPTVAGVAVDAEMVKSAPVVLSSTLMLLSGEFVTTRSGALSWLNSAAAAAHNGVEPVCGPPPTAKLKGD